MLGYVTFGTNDFEKAIAYYDALVPTVGAKRVMEMDNFKMYGTSPSTPGLAIMNPFDKNAATVGNGTMAAIMAPNREAVDACHAKALELGSADEGGPGDRGEGFYAAYFRDLDGNKLCVFNYDFGG